MYKIVNDFPNDFLAQVVMQNGGKVIVVTQEKMPSSTGTAAIYRF